MAERAKIRLYVTAKLAQGQAVPLGREQTHYLINVMRLSPGAAVALFNGADGEWFATLAQASRKGAIAICDHQQAPQTTPPDLWLLFAPVKKARTDFIIEKAVELGAARLMPVMTRYTNAERIRDARVQTHIIEAAEQCGATHLPHYEPPQKLDKLLKTWDAARRILFCDETRTAPPIARVLRSTGPWAILIGPEGGFAPEESAALRAHPAITPCTLGPRVLRADTAALAALAIWQSTLGDWG